MPFLVRAKPNRKKETNNRVMELHWFDVGMLFTSSLRFHVAVRLLSSNKSQI